MSLEKLIIIISHFLNLQKEKKAIVLNSNFIK